MELKKHFLAMFGRKKKVRKSNLEWAIDNALKDDGVLLTHTDSYYDGHDDHDDYADACDYNGYRDSSSSRNSGGNGSGGNGSGGGSNHTFLKIIIFIALTLFLYDVIYGF